jgi:LEA14-like dessication related protein
MKKSSFRFCIPILCLLLSCSQPMPPEYLGFRDFSVQNFNMDQAILHAQLSFYNPNAFAMELKKGNVNVFLNDQLANHYVLDSTINIPKKDTFYVPLNLNISPKLLLNSAIRMLMNDNTLKVRFEGSIRVKRGSISFNVPVNYETTQKMQQFN